MDDPIELLDMSRQLEAGELSPLTSLSAAATIPTRARQDEVQPGCHTDKNLFAAECAYDTLDADFVRLVRITQNPMTGDIECLTDQFSLHYPPPYIALSYACGSRPATCHLKLNGSRWRVRKNLHRFIRQRLQMNRDPQEWLWIDAICINQGNPSERNHQVRLMADIYGKAFRVIVWLGRAYEQSDDAMRGLLKSQGRERSLETVPWILALVGLCSRRYWHRLWVLQELKLAKQKDLMCGSKVISWQHFETFMFLVERSFQEPTPPALSGRIRYIRNSAAMRMIMLTSTPLGTSLWDLLDMSAHLQYEETTDRVYALCGIATAEAASIDPDYEIDMPVLLNKVLKYHIEQIPKISILTVASACAKLESIFGTQPRTVFAFPHSTNHLPGIGLIHRRVCTHSLSTRGLTLLWAIHYEHLLVQELIKMVHRKRIPRSLMFLGSQVVILVVGLPFAFESASPDQVIGLTGSFTVYLCLIILTVLKISTMNGRKSRFSKCYTHVDLNGKRENEAARSWYTALGHRSAWRSCWWVPFVVSEGLIYIAAPAFRPLKRCFVGSHFRWRRGSATNAYGNNVERPDWLIEFEEYPQAC